ARHVLPSGALVLVVSKGDNELLDLGDRRAFHFPQTEKGYFSHYPANSAEAIAHLEDLRKKGADYLLFPSTSYWWLDFYKEFRQHLETHCRTIFSHPQTCTIFQLRDKETEAAQVGTRALGEPLSLESERASHRSPVNVTSGRKKVLYVSHN